MQGVAWAQETTPAVEISSIETQAQRLDGLLQAGTAAVGRHATNVEERFADAELLYRLRDYARASVLFTDIVENYANTPAYPQGLYLLADSLYLAGDRYGARTRFRQVLDHASEPVFGPFVQRALGRLIEIALRLNDYDGVDGYFQRLGQIPSSEISAQTSYIRGKYLFLRHPPDYDGARQAFEAIPAHAPIYPQARYFLGAILTAQQRYPEAIEAFQRVLAIQPDGSDQAEQQQVVDLAALAIGRLQIERENFDAAIDAYSQVGRSSPFFDRALFEQSWAFIKSGDAVRAERALEILAISSPDSPLIPEGKILWGNLLLRSGRFDRAQQVFEEVRAQFGPIYVQLQQMNAQHSNPEQYFQELVRSNLQVFDATSFIPAEALAWVRHDGALDESLQVVSDLNVCRTYVRDASEIIDQLNAALGAPSRSHVFADLGRARQNVWELLNRAAQIRAQIATEMDSRADVGNVEVQGLISERRALGPSVARLPVDDEGMRRRDRQAEGEFQTLSQEVQRNEQRVEALEAMVVALEHYLSDPTHAAPGVSADEIRRELTTQHQAIQQYRDRVSALRRQIEEGRAQIGPGDPRFAHDVVVRQQVRDVVGREAAALRAAGRMPTEADGLLVRLDGIDRLIGDFDGRVNVQVDQRIQAIQAQVREEQARVAGYRERLAALEGESSEVVGNLILQQFRNVQVHFYQIVMRSDLGLVDVAWEQREEHNNRNRMLAEEETREISSLNDEFSEVTEGASLEDRQVLNAHTGANATRPGTAVAPTVPPTQVPTTQAPPTQTPPTSFDLHNVSLPAGGSSAAPTSTSTPGSTSQAPTAGAVRGQAP